MKASLFTKVIFIFFLLLSSFQSDAQKIGFLLDSYVMDRWYTDTRIFTNKVKSLGGECIVEVANGDAVAQVKLGKKMIDEGVKVLAVVPIDANLSAEIVAYAKAKNAVVISYDRMINSNDLSLYIGYDSEKVGKMEAEYALRTDKFGRVMLVNGPTTDNNAILLRQGQKKELEPAIKDGKVTILADVILNEWSEIEAFMKMEEIFPTLREKPTAILCGNDAIANGVLQVLPKELLGKVIIVGQDADYTALTNILKGHQTMTLYKPIQNLAEKAAESAMKLSKGEAIEMAKLFKTGNFQVNAILLNPIAVDKGNYIETVVSDGHVSLSKITD